MTCTHSGSEASSTETCVPFCRTARIVEDVLFSARRRSASAFTTAPTMAGSEEPEEPEDEVDEEEEEDEADDEGADDEDGEDETVPDVDPPVEEPVVVMRRYSLLHQPSLPEAVRTFAQPALELSVTVSFVPFASTRSVS